MYPGVPDRRGRAQGVPARPQGRGRRAQARRQVRLEGRRRDPAPRHDLSRAPGSSRCAASTTAPTPRSTSTQFFFHWELPERDDASSATRAARDQVGVLRGRDHATRRRRRRSRSAIDAQFKNSLAETLTETEQAFQLGFVAMTEAIVVAIQAVSLVVIVIIMAVMANTMAMTARERYGRVRDAEGARLRPRLRRAADLRRIAGDRAGSAARSASR